MKVGTLLLLLADIVSLLEAKSILLADGSFDADKLDTIGEDLEFAAAVEDLLRKYGVDVPEKIDKIIKLLPLLASAIQ